jgi:hypothetical protein
MNIYSGIKKIYYLLLSKKRQNYINMLIANGLTLGKKVDIIDTFFFDPSHCFLISMGDNCTICPNVSGIILNSLKAKSAEIAIDNGVDIDYNLGHNER